MKHRLSVIMVTLNAQELLQQSLTSANAVADEIIVVDSGSTDRTIEILKKFNVRLVKSRTNHLGANKARALSLVKGDLVLLLDSDEILSSPLIRTIRRVKGERIVADGYIIPFRNHFLGRRVRYGGESYEMLRMGKTNKLRVKNVSVHESLTLTSKNLVRLNSYILHYSYRTLTQTYRKFTTYALNEATERFKKGEKSSLKKIFLYPIHMCWARFVKDQGYRDGIFRIPLDLGFAYMELITYLVLACKNIGL